jgi:hypothetical protein
MRKCDYCFEIGHKRSDCPKLTEDLEQQKAAEKKKQRLREYAAKKEKRRLEYANELRKKTGMTGHGPL